LRFWKLEANFGVRKQAKFLRSVCEKH